MTCATDDLVLPPLQQSSVAPSRAQASNRTYTISDSLGNKEFSPARRSIPLGSAPHYLVGVARALDVEGAGWLHEPVCLPPPYPSHRSGPPAIVTFNAMIGE